MKKITAILLFSLIITNSIFMISCSQEKNEISNRIDIIQNTESEKLSNIIEKIDTGAHGGGTAICAHDSAYNDSYHTITGVLIDFVGKKEFEIWTEQKYFPPTNYCKYSNCTILNFIEYFDIKREDFEKMYYQTSCYATVDYNVNILYSGDKKEVEYYYTNLCADNIEEMKLRAAIRYFKDMLIDDVLKTRENENYEKWITSLDKTGIIEWMKTNLDNSFLTVHDRLWNIPQFIEYFNVPQNNFDKYIEIFNLNHDYQFECDVNQIYASIENQDYKKMDINSVDRMIIHSVNG